MKTFLIPVELCEYVLAKKITKPFKLYIHMKSMSSGVLKLDLIEKQILADTLNYECIRSVNNNLKKLRVLNFIGYNPKSRYYFIRSFNNIKAQLGINSSTCAIFNTSEIQQLQAFCAAAVTCYIVQQQKTAEWKLKKREKMARLSERIKGRSIQDNRPSILNTVSNTLLQMKLGSSLSAAYKWKHDAERAGYLRIIPNLQPLGIPVAHKRIFIKAHPELRNIVRIKRRKLYLQRSDIIIPIIKFKQGR